MTTMIAPGHQLKIGELLVTSGVLTLEQVETILTEQKRTARPFGDLAERFFGVDPDIVEQAWLDQYLSYDLLTNLDEQSPERRALRALSRRQAWQFRILPLRYEQGHLLAATSRKQLRRAVGFAWSTLRDPVCFLIAEESQLEASLGKHYPWIGGPGLVFGR